MGCGSSSLKDADGGAGREPNGEKARNAAIDKQLEEDAKKLRRECKILLLGASSSSSSSSPRCESTADSRRCPSAAGSGESGKSTIVKQMKIMYQGGYARDEMLLFRLSIHKNVLDSAQGLVLAMRRFKLEPVEDVNRAYADKIMDHRLEADTYSTSSPTLPTTSAAGASGGGGIDGGLSAEIVRAIDSLWHDPIIPSVLDRQSEFYLMDSAP